MGARETRGSAGEPDAGEVAAGKGSVALDRPGRDDDPLGVDEVEEVLPVHGNERPLVHTDRGCVLENRHPLATAKLGGETLDPLPSRPGRELLADRPLVREDNRLPGLRRGQRSGEAGDSASCHEQVGVAVPGLAVRAGEVERGASDAGDAANERLGARPGAGRPDERLVVEADRQEPAQHARRPRAHRGRPTASRSRGRRDGHRRAAVTQARTPGSPSTVTRQFGQSPVRQ